MQVSLGFPPEFVDQLSAAVLASMKKEIRAASQAATVAKDAEVLFTVKEAAEKLKLCEKTVLLKIAEGKLNAANFGAWERPQYRISKADLTAFYNNHRLRA